MGHFYPKWTNAVSSFAHIFEMTSYEGYIPYAESTTKEQP